MPRHARLVLAALVAGGTPALGGCESLMVMTGLRMRLDGVPLQAVAASMPGDGRLAPGAQATLSVIATTTDGRTLASAGTGDGKVLLDSYAFEASGGASVDADGVVRLPADPRLTEGRVPHVRIPPAGQPGPVTELDIPIRYDVPFETAFAGPPGWDGSAGADGSEGATGASGSSDPANPSPGGNGGNGGPGGNGEDGGTGGPGPDVQVRVALAPGDHPLLHVRTIATGEKDRYFIVDPQGGSLALTVSGGRGGSGGLAGRGGAGGAGGPGMPPGAPGSPGFDGLAGHDGWGGPAGHVAIEVDPAAAAYVDRLQVTNVDGNGRPGTPPSVAIGPVPAPW